MKIEETTRSHSYSALSRVGTSGPGWSMLALRYFLVSIFLIGGIFLTLDRFIIPFMEDQGKLESHLWAYENHRLNHFIYLRNKGDKVDPVWRSAGMPVEPARRKAKRILVMGDSFVWGDGYANANTIWWRQLQEELTDRGYEDVEVIAAGLCGASTHTQLNWLKRLLPEYRPDLVILGYVTNDPEETDEKGKQYVKMLPKEFTRTSPVVSLIKPIAPNLAGQLAQIHKVNRQRLINGKFNRYEYADWELKVLEGPNFEAYKKTVGELSLLLKEAGVPAFVMGLPAGFQNKTAENTEISSSDRFFESVRRYHVERYGPVKPVFRRAGLPFVDITDGFIETARRDAALNSSDSALRLGINPGNGHPGAFATHFYAVSAADVIERDFPQCLPARVSASPTKTSGSSPLINDWVPPHMGLIKTGHNEFVFVYPSDTKDETLFMPIRKRHVQLNLARPVEAEAISLYGDNLKSADVFATFHNRNTGYDDGSVTKIGSAKGRQLTLSMPQSQRLLSTIKLSAKFNGPDRRLKLTIKEPLHE